MMNYYCYNMKKKASCQRMIRNIDIHIKPNVKIEQLFPVWRSIYKKNIMIGESKMYW